MREPHDLARELSKIAARCRSARIGPGLLLVLAFAWIVACGLAAFALAVAVAK